MASAETLGPSWAVLWSPNQGCLHYELISDTMLTNIRMLKSEAPSNDYLLLWAGPRSEIDEALELFRPFVNAQRIARGIRG